MKEGDVCDHHWLTDVQLGEYVECELCGLIFLRKDWGKTEQELKKEIMDERVIAAKQLKEELGLLLDKHSAYLMAEYYGGDGEPIQPYISAYINHTDGKYQSTVRVDLGEHFE